MFWGCFEGTGVMELTDLMGYPESKGGRVTEQIILESALKMLPQIPDGHSDLIFMQDEAGVHQRKELVAQLKENKYDVLEWPPYSPDLNPIEHVLAELKRLVYQLHPELYTAEGLEML